MAGDSLGLWLQKQVKPFCQASSERLPAQGLSWISFLLSFSAGVILYAAGEKPELAYMVVPLILLRLIFDAMEKVLADGASKLSVADTLVNKLCGRLGDLSIFFGLAFSEDIRVHLVLFAVVSMLVVSYVGELGRSLGASGSSGGILCQTHRLVFVVFFSVIYALQPQSQIMGFSVFEVMFVLFIPLSSITLLQRMANILSFANRRQS